MLILIWTRASWIAAIIRNPPTSWSSILFIFSLFQAWSPKWPASSFSDLAAPRRHWLSALWLAHSTRGPLQHRVRSSLRYVFVFAFIYMAMQLDKMNNCWLPVKWKQDLLHVPYVENIQKFWSSILFIIWKHRKSYFFIFWIPDNSNLYRNTPHNPFSVICRPITSAFQP